MNASDRLQHSSEPPDQDSSGIKASYLLELPPAQRRIMRLLLRHAEMTLIDLRKAVDALPEGEQMSSDQMDEAVKNLVEQNWLIRLEANDTMRYKANFQRKVESGGEKTSPRRRSVGSVARGVWDALEAKDKKE